MKIAVLSDRFRPQPGGLANAAHRIACGLADRGHSVDVFAVDATLAPDRISSIADGPLRVHWIGAHRREEDTAADLFDRMAAAHREEKVDVLHGFYAVRAGFLAAYLGRYLGLPSVVSVRGNDVDRSVLDPGRTASVIYALQHASVVTTVSTDLARKVEALAPRARVLFIPNGVDAERFRPVPPDEAVRRAWVLEGRAVVGFAGELRAKKGLHVLMEALGSLSLQRPLTLLLAGGVRADDEGTLALLRRRHPQVQVAALPWREATDLPAVYACMDVFVHPSLRDGMPNAMLEAMACARPVVASRAGGIPDVVRDGVDGLLVPPGDADALASAIASILDDRLRAASLSRRGRERVLADFTTAAESRAYESLHLELAAAARTPRGAARALASR